MTVVVSVIHGVVLAVQIPVEACAGNSIAPENVFLREPVHLRLIEPRPEIDHARSGIIVFPVVAKARGCFPNLLPKRGIAFTRYILPSQRAAEGIPCVVVADLRRYTATDIVDVLRPVAAGLGGNAFQTVGVVGGILARGLGDQPMLSSNYLTYGFEIN